jgi:predicted AAA+ superfamily ATPase
VYPRVLDLAPDLERRSLLLFGARQTGKSTLLQRAFAGARFVDLLEANTFRELSFRPESLRESLTGREKLIVVDEIQKLPSLLDEVQLLIHRNRALRFVLTGSSARKLRRGGANLLGGRARTRHLFPLAWPEYGATNLPRVLEIGSLPSILTSDEPHEDLAHYVGTYLTEEIRAEALARSIEAFSRFLAVAGHATGEQLNFTKVGSDAQVPPRTVREYFQVLVDTLVGYEVPPFATLVSRKPVATSKFYFFDIGVAHALQGVKHVPKGSPAFGRALEHLVANELRAFLAYRRREETLTYYRTTSQLEVDFLVGDRIAIEVKGTGRVASADVRHLRSLVDDVPSIERRVVVCMESTRRRIEGGIDVLPVGEFLQELWSGALVNP